MKLKVISGEKKGFILKVPNDTRPLSSRAKSALFSILDEYIKGSAILDLYAGSGALGIEALSRGAEYVEFIDISKEATDIIEENIEKTQMQDKSEVYRIPAEIYVKKNKNIKLFDIIFVFQPYDKTNENILKNAKKLLNNKGIIVFEKEKNKNIRNIKGLRVVDERTYGKTSILFYILSPEE